MTSRVITAIATRQGTSENNADAVAVFTSEAGVTAVCVVDMIGHSPQAPAVGWLCAETAVRVGARSGPLAGVLAAAALVADPGTGTDPEPSGVTVLALAHPGEETRLAWVGDCAAYGWDGTTLHPRTTPQSMGEFLRWNQDTDLAPQHDNWVRVDLATAVATTVAVSAVPASEPLVLLVSDGVADQVPPHVMEHLVRQHATDPQTLAQALVDAARDQPTGRDDATAAAVLLSPIT
jgi:PPM family protein phosphatase